MLTKKTWKERRLIFGKTMSSAPTISGMRKLPKAARRTGMATQKIMMVPWLVTRALYSPGETIPNPGTGIPGKASCIRKTYAMNPPIRAMKMPVNRYCMAMTL